MCVSVFACMYVNASYVHLKSEEGIRSPKTGVMDGCELPCGFWELNPGPLQDQLVLLLLSHLPESIQLSCIQHIYIIVW